MFLEKNIDASPVFIITCMLFFSFVFQPVAFAGGRSSAGGGDIEHFDTGRVATNIGIGLGAMAIGGAISSGIKAGSLSTAGSTLYTSATSARTIATNYNTFVAATQVNRAVGQAGSYHDWNNSTTFVVSSVATGATGGFLNSSVAIGDSMSGSTLNSSSSQAIAGASFSDMTKGAFIGSLSGLGSGATIVAIDGDKINSGKEPGIGAQIAGLAVGAAGANLAKGLLFPDPKIKTYQRVQAPDNQGVSDMSDTPTPSSANTNDICDSKTFTQNNIADPVMSELHNQANRFSKTPSSISVERLANQTTTNVPDSPSNLSDDILGPTTTPPVNTFVPVVYVGPVQSAPTVPTGSYNVPTQTESIVNSMLSPDVYGPVDNSNISVSGVLGSNSLSAQPATVPIFDSARVVPTTREAIYEIKKVNMGMRVNVADRFQKTEVTSSQLADLKSQCAPGSDYYDKPINNEMSTVSPKQGHISAQGLLDATFVKTADMWPQIASKATSMVAVNSMNEDDQQRYGALVSSVVEGVASPVISTAAETYGLKPSLYFGGNTTTNRIAYIDNLNQSALAHTMNKNINPALREVYNSGEGSVEEYRTVLDQKGLEKVEVRPVQSVEQFKSDYMQNLNNRLQAHIIDEEGYRDGLKELAQEVKHYNPQARLLGDVSSKARTDTGKKIGNAPTMADALKIAGTSRTGLFLENGMREARFGLVEGTVSGGMSSLASAASKGYDPLASAAVSYGAAMLGGAARGAFLYATWQENLDESWGKTRDNKIMPQRNGGNDYEYSQQIKAFNKFGRNTGLELKSSPGGPSYEIIFNDERPGLEKAVLTGMAQSNLEFLNRSFSFAAPQRAPENVNSYALTEYLNTGSANLKQYAISAGKPGGFEAVLEQNYLYAGASAVGNDISNSAATVQPVAAGLGMQQQRLVGTNAPNAPYTIQSRDYRGWATNTKVLTEFPYPNPTSGPRSATGQTFISDNKK